MYNNPYFNPYVNFQVKPSLFSKLKTLSFSEILNGTQKTLNIINQAIPIVYQVKPLINNTKTIFKIANAINNDNNVPIVEKKEDEKKEPSTNKNIKYNEPTFFI